MQRKRRRSSEPRYYRYRRAAYAFLGGNKKAKITIQETKENLIAFGVEYPEARTKRAVVFSDTGEYVWADFERVPTNLELKTLFQSIKGGCTRNRKDVGGTGFENSCRIYAV